MIKCAYAILPYKELIDITQLLSAEYELEVLPDEKNAENAIPAAVNAEKNGARVIISRGGTAEIIKKHVHIPVVDIRVSDLDILRLLYPLRGLDRKILVVGFKNAVTRCRSVAEVLEFDIQELLIPYEKAEYNFDSIKYDAERIINRYGIDTIIGDQTAYINLQSLCRNLYLIKSGRDDVIEAIERTESTLASRFNSNSNTRYVKNVLDFVNDAVISADDQGIITVFNSQAEKLFNKKQEAALGSRIDKVIGRTCLGSLKYSVSEVLRTGTAKKETISGLESGLFTVSTSPILTNQKTIGVVLAISSIPEHREEEQKTAKKIHYQGFSTRYKLSDILTIDDSFRKKIRIAEEYAQSDATVLIEGESGTGKELFAQGIHSASKRWNAPFVAVNCAAIPAPLLESELFGYVDGAFTDASKRGKKGLFEIADKGTIFLDEISEIEKSLQVKFLRVLEEKQIMRIGADCSFTADVRVIAATNGNLRDEVAAGRFRPDLYYRLNLLNLRVPPLKEHCADIKYLAEYFFKQYSETYGIKSPPLSLDIIKILTGYSWPGNIRELKNVMERLALASGSGKLDPEAVGLIAGDLYDNCGKFTLNCKNLADVKYNTAIEVLKEENYNKSRAAKKLGIDRSTLDRILAAKQKEQGSF